MNEVQTAVFLDTMIYLHYRHVEEVDWTSVLRRPRILIVIPRITVRELDKHKDSHSSREIRERARRILQRIAGWADQCELREGVRIQAYNRLPKVDFSEHDLDPTRNDDVLIASILQFREDQPGTDVLLVTQDTTPKLTARPLGVPVDSLPEDLRLQATADPVEQENRELRRQLDRLRAATPKLALQFGTETQPEDGHVLRTRLVPPPHGPEPFVATRIAELERKYPPLSRSSAADSRTTIAAALSVLGGIPDEEFARYERDRARYFEAMRQYMRLEWDRILTERLSIDLIFELTNTGTVPAEDVDVYLHFPDGFTLIQKEAIPRLREEPSPPLKPRTHSQLLNDSLRSLQPYQPSYDSFFRGISGAGREHNVSSPDIEKSHSYDVHWHIKRVKHQQPVELDHLRTTFASFGDAGSFGIGYRLIAANIPSPIEGRLNVVLERG